MLKNYLLVLLSLWFCQGLSAQYREYNEATKKRGISDFEGTPIIPAEYDDILPYKFENDTFYIAQKGNWKGAFDKTGRLTTPFEYEELEIWAAQSHFQFGYALATKNRRADSAWGLISVRNGQVILPFKFEFVRAIFPDLLVGRQFADSTLQFFNEQGKPLFQLFGRSASPGFDQNSVEIKRVDRSLYFVDKIGRPIFPPNLKRPKWTDGKLVICVDDNGNYGLVSMNGKTLLPFEWKEMKVQNPGHFWVRAKDGQEAVIDAKAQFIIPLSAGRIYQPRGTPGASYIRADVGSDPQFNFNIYHSSGKLLYSEVRVSSVAMVSEFSNGPFNRREDYFTVEFKGKKEQLVFHITRGQILPTTWNTVWYGGEKHPLIAVRNDENGLPLEYKIFDLNGKLLFAAPAGMSLKHTRNPRLLLAQIENGSRAALINLDKAPEKTAFEYNRIRPFYNGYFRFEQNQNTGLLDPKGKELVPAGKFTSIEEPDKIQIKAFRENKVASGKLVAVGKYKGLVYPAWVGLNERGEDFLFEPQPAPPREEIKNTEPPVSDAPLPLEVEKTELTEAQIVEAPGEVLEEMPAKPAIDEVFPFAQKQPEFPGGQAALLKFLNDNLIYPPLAKEAGIVGQVILSFIVEKDGSLSDIKILRDIGAGCGEEALRLARAMPKWMPGSQNGKIVRVKYTQMIGFNLR